MRYVLRLTWQPTEHYRPNDGKQGLCEDRRIEVLPRWAFSVNTQAGIWRRKDLLRIIGGVPLNVDIWSAEQAWSHCFHETLWQEGKRMLTWNYPDPPQPGPWVDGVDKSEWALAYHNLSVRRQMDPRHRKFLLEEGLLS